MPGLEISTSYGFPIVELRKSGYHLLVAIEKTLLDKGVHTSWGSVKETLRTHQVSTIVLPADNDAVLRIRNGSTPEPQHKEIYDLLGISHEVIRPKKIWDDT